MPAGGVEPWVRPVDLRTCVRMESPNHRGAVSESAIVLAALQQGVEVYRPASEHARADFVFSVSGRLYRVQCKTARLSGDVLSITLVSSRRSADGYVRTKYELQQIDLIAAYSPDLQRAYLMPLAELEGMTRVSLRTAAPRNQQRAGVHYAADYEFPGAVAQLGERLHGMQEVVGSSPISSTSQDSDEASPGETETVGAHEFRNRFGWYMERAAAGEQIHVSRHGSPYVRLLPASEALVPQGSLA